MPTYLIRQTVEHPNINKKIIKKTHIYGYDLKHAIGMLPKKWGEEFLRRLSQSYIARLTDDSGRVLTVEIIEEKKA